MQLTQPVQVSNTFPQGRTVTGATDTILASDAGTTVVYTSGSAIAVTVPNGIFAAQASVQLLQMGAGRPTATATTLRVPSGFVAAPSGQYAACTIYHAGGNEYVAGGRLAAS